MRLAHFGLILFPGLALAGVTHPSPHRKVENGIGNCIFSSQPLKFQADSSYRPKRSFSQGEKVYARCYYPKTTGEYRNEGKLKSQLRGIYPEPPRVNRRLQFDQPTWNYAHTVRADAKNWSKDMQYMWIVPSGDCDFKKVPRTGDCVDLEHEVRKLAASKKESLPFTTEICVHIDFDVVNRKVPNPANALERIDKREFVTIAKGCFEYTLRE